MGIDQKYGKITPEFGNIGENEPVFIFRAQDALLPRVLEHYAWLCENNGSAEPHVASVDKSREIIQHWQQFNKTKTPDDPS